MLTLTRKAGQKIRIGDDIEIVVREIRGRQVRLGISAPEGMAVYREELYQQILAEGGDPNAKISALPKRARDRANDGSESGDATDATDVPEVQPTSEPSDANDGG